MFRGCRRSWVSGCLLVSISLLFQACSRRSEDLPVHHAGGPLNGQAVGNGDSLAVEVAEEARMADQLVVEQVLLQLDALRAAKFPDPSTHRLVQPLLKENFPWKKFQSALGREFSTDWPTGCPKDAFACTLNNSDLVYLAPQNQDPELTLAKAKRVCFHEALHAVYPNENHDKIRELTRGFVELAKIMGDDNQPRWVRVSNFARKDSENTDDPGQSVVAWTGDRLAVWDPQKGRMIRYYDPFGDRWSHSSSPQLSLASTDQTGSQTMLGTWTADKLAVLTQPWYPASEGIAIVVYDPFLQHIRILNMALFRIWDLATLQIIDAGNAIVIWSAARKIGRFFYARDLAWKRIAPFPYEAPDKMKAAWVRGKLYLLWDENSSGTEIIGAVYNPDTEEWSEILAPSFALPETENSLVLSTGRRLVVFGPVKGSSGNQTILTGAIYSSESGWEKIDGGVFFTKGNSPALLVGGVTKTKLVVRTSFDGIPTTSIYDFLLRKWTTPRIVDPQQNMTKVFFFGLGLLFWNNETNTGAIFRY
jgi:hypothetical protein